MIKRVITSDSRSIAYRSAEMIELLSMPAALFIEGKCTRANQAFLRIFNDQNCPVLADKHLHQVIDESLIVKDTLAVDVKFNQSVYHCIISPLSHRDRTVLVLFEDTTIEAQGDRNNALLYRISLILSVSEQSLQERLQLTAEQILLELSIFDCTIFLFDRVDGFIKPIAWATNDLKSRTVSRGNMRVGEGISGTVALTHRPIVVPDMSKDKRIVRRRINDHELGLLSVPMTSNGTTIGVFSTTRVKTEPFSDRDLQFFSTIANRLASLIENSRKDDEEEMQNTIVSLLSATQQLEQRYPQVLQSIAQLLRVDMVMLLSIDQPLKELRLLCANNEQSLTARQKKWILRELRMKKYKSLLRKGEVIVLTDKQETTLLFPLCIEKRCDYILFVKDTLWQRSFTEHELSMGQTAATQLVGAMKSALFHNEAQAERKKLQQIQNTLQDGLILYTPDLKIDSYNNSAKRILGIKKDITGLSWDEAMNERMNTYCKYRLLRQFDPKKVFHTILTERKGATVLATVTCTPPKTLEISIVPVFDTNNQISGILSHFRDITPMYELQSKMAIRVKQLTNLFKISSVTGFDVQHIVRKILTLVLRLLSVRACQLLLVNSDDDKLYIVESLGDKGLVDEVDNQLAKKIERVAKTLQPITATVKRSDKSTVQALITPVLGHHNACIGALLVADKEDASAFSREDTNLLAIVAARIAMKIDNARLVKQVESDREKMAAIIEQSADGILVIDAERRIQLWNSALERITGIGVEEVRGQLTDDIELTLGSPQNVTASDGASEIQIENRKTGKKLWIGATYAAITNGGEVTGYVAIIRDISRRKELEQAKNEFVSTASHELRSPITAIVGYLSMLKRGDVGSFANPNQEKFIDKAYQNSKRMVDLIEDLLMTTRMETGQLRYQYEPIDAHKTVETIVSDLEFRALEKDITLTVEATKAPFIYADRDAVHQVVTNVVTNAIKYTPSHGKVTVKFQEQLRQGSPYLTIVVKDSGVGIDTEDLHKVFDKFTRIDNPLSVSAGGTGLGLYITKMIVEELGGKIWVKSKSGEGSTFYISLPIYQSKRKGIE